MILPATCLMSVPQGEAEEQDTPWPSQSAATEEWSPPLCLPCPPSGHLPLQTFWCIPKVSGVGLRSLRSSTQMSPSQSDCPWPSAPPWDSLPVLLLSLVLLTPWNILFLFFVVCSLPFQCHLRGGMYLSVPCCIPQGL